MPTGYLLGCLTAFLVADITRAEKNVGIAIVILVVLVAATLATTTLLDPGPRPPRQGFGISQEVRTELVSRISSGELVVLHQTEIDTYSGVQKRAYFGMLNAKRYPVCVFATIRCIGAQTPDENAPGQCAPGVPKGAIVGGTGFDASLSKRWVFPKPAGVLKPTAVDVAPLEIQISGAKKDTYFMELIVAENLAADPASPADAADCSGADAAIDPLTGAIGPGWGEIDTKQFVINVQ